ncbi:MULTISPECIES: membrane lipoprotein lipid attachment site-containing protein [Bacillaceae]|uniref:Lipoprotein n=1 Tax=Domibacillus aminovorans TaxID=29332 RepID=A0A177KHP9_9BACI|nr:MULTISPECIES: membrane lipoprotein lipid attachment site-containing protein [Bacillaceae]OAH52918.1 hypothetical protein AWH48_14020 [Domibacillus aminovorans]
MKKLFLITVLVLVLSACGGRDLSNVKTSLYGHWKDEESDTHYYISDGSFIQVDDEGQEEKTYKVLEHDEVKNIIQIREEGEDGSGFIREITFDNDERTSAEVLTDSSTFEFGNEVGGSEDAALNEFVKQTIKENMTVQVFEENWEYLDEKQNP